MSQALAPDRDWLLAARRAKALSWFSLAWMTGEGVLGLQAGLSAGSIGLIGWALGSVIEGLASLLVIWRLSGARLLSRSAERRAQRGVAVSFYLLAPYLTLASVRDLLDRSPLSPNVLGVIVTAASLVVMPLLGLAKRSLGVTLGSAATTGEGVQNLMCAAQAGAVLIGLGATAAFGWLWIDPVVGLVLAAWAIYEGRNAWSGNGCC